MLAAKFTLTNWKWLSAACLAFGAAGILIISLVYQFSIDHSDYLYGVVIDAGSSHSTVYLYRWQWQKHNGTGAVGEVTSCDVKFPVTHDSDDQSKLTACVDQVSSAMDPTWLKSESTLFLEATAGLRLKHKMDPNNTDHLLDSIKSKLSDKTGLSVQSVELLTGIKEGVYAWATVNYALNNLLDESANQSAAILDMGGASLQYARETDDPASVGSNLTFFGSSKHVYSQSSLCYGSDQAALRYTAILISKSPWTGSGTLTINDPCLQTGTSVHHDFDSIYASYCTKAEQLLRPEPGRYQSVTAIGSGNASQCSDYVQDMLLDWNYCRLDAGFAECSPSMAAELHPPADMPIIATASFVHGLSIFDPLSTGKINEESARNQSNDLCDTPFDEIRTKWPRINPKYASEYCFLTQYTLGALEGLFNITGPAEWDRLQFDLTLNGLSVGWALGFMLDATNQLPAYRPWHRNVPVGVLVTFELVCAALLVVGLLIIYLGVKEQRRIARQYQSNVPPSRYNDLVLNVS